MDSNIKHPILEYLPNAIENIRKIHNLDKGRIEQSIDILDDWIKKQDHLLNKNFERRYLDIAIISCKGSVEKAKSQIDKLCTFKTLLPKFFICSDIKNLLDSISDIAYFVVLPKMTKDYERVFFIKVNEKEFTSKHYLTYYRLQLVMCEYLKAHDYINGFVVVEDFRDINLMNLLTKMNFVEFQQYLTILIEGFGARLRKIHIVTKSKMVDVFIKTVKPLLSQKIADRIEVLPEMEDVHKHIDKEILPVELGGTERSLTKLQAEWADLLCSKEHVRYLEETVKSCTDESLRQTGKFNEQYMGLPGSFRTLTVD